MGGQGRSVRSPHDRYHLTSAPAGPGHVTEEEVLFSQQLHGSGKDPSLSGCHRSSPTGLRVWMQTVQKSVSTFCMPVIAEP